MHRHRLHAPRTLPFAIPPSELHCKAVHSGGPGGQHVNKANTKVQLLWDLERSQLLDPEQKARLRERLAHRIDRHGMLHVASQRFRSQHQNREDALARLHQLVAEALKPVPERRATRPSRGSHRRRLEHKSRRARIKKLRRRPGPDD
ncbi:MAG: aminoacyl-tRNA hydrolase [Planctomycetota bacterium]|nr:MAG: aminoacyl-tRNA hydrolase [Planctomycetota bacterium]